MKKFISGLLVGLIIASSGFVFANNPIKMIVNGTEIHADVPPQVIDGRTMVPARALAESLGAEVTWDAENHIVLIESRNPHDLSEDWTNIKEYDDYVPFLVETKEGYTLNILTSSNLYQLLIRDNEVYIKNN